MRAIATISTPSDDRGKKRVRERTARRRRAANIERMKHTMNALERAVLVTLTLGDADALWEDFLDARTMHVRHCLRESVTLARQANTLTLEQTHLQRLLQEHRLSSQYFYEVLTEPTTDVWEWEVERLRVLTRQHYRPWTLEQCQHEMDAALQEVNTFRWSADKQTTGLSFLGWHESRRVDHVRGAFQFQFYKTFRGFDVMDYVNTAWDAYTDATRYKEVIVGHRLLGAHEVLQQLGPNVIIARGHQRYPEVGVDVHMVFLVFRVQTARGFTQCVRSICCPELAKAIDNPRHMWASNSIWLDWELLEGNEEQQRDNGYRLGIGGSIGGTDANYLNQWMMKIFRCVLTSERLATGRQLITSG